MLSRSGGARQPVVDRLAQTFKRDRRDRDAIEAKCVELVQKVEKIRRCFREIAACREIQHIFSLAKNPAEIEARLRAFKCFCLKTKFRTRCVMRG